MLANFFCLLFGVVNSKVVGCETESMSWKMLKRLTELTAVWLQSSDKSPWVCHFLWRCSCKNISSSIYHSAFEYWLNNQHSTWKFVGKCWLWSFKFLTVKQCDKTRSRLRLLYLNKTGFLETSHATKAPGTHPQGYSIDWSFEEDKTCQLYLYCPTSDVTFTACFKKHLPMRLPVF